MGLSRRDLLKLAVLGSGVVLLPVERTIRAVSQSRLPESSLPAPFTVPFAAPPVLTPFRTDATTDYYALTMQEAVTEIIPGFRTRVWGYGGIVPGPTIDATHGRQVVVRHINLLPTAHPVLGYRPDASVHLHGSASLPQFDGYANDLIQPGQYKDYRYYNDQGGRTLWYHDHAAHYTSANVYMGLAGLYRVHDPAEAALSLPSGRYDIPLVVSDALFASDGELLWDTDDESDLFGDVILVNGRPWPAMPVERRKYRFRILNASVSRSYRWQLDSGDSFWVIATDGGLMPQAQRVSQLRHSNAERYEVVIDFARYPIGRRIVLRNLSNKKNIDYATTANVMAFDVVADATSTAGNAVPDILNPSNPVMQLTAAMAEQTRTLRLERSGGQWTINGSTWDDVVDSGFRRVIANPRLGAVEIWRLVNNSGGWFHPLHIHLVDFRILDRNGRAPSPHERGPKDVAYVGPNETVRVVARFKPHAGRYMIHCHNLVHEDHAMMHQFEVGSGGPDPMTYSPAQWLPASPL